MTASYTGVNAGFVAVVCDDPGLAFVAERAGHALGRAVREAPYDRAGKPAEA